MGWLEKASLRRVCLSKDLKEGREAAMCISWRRVLQVKGMTNSKGGSGLGVLRTSKEVTVIRRESEHNCGQMCGRRGN